MDAKQCDRCGAFYTENKNSFGINNTPICKVSAYRGDICAASRTYDLCDDCMKKFLYDFMLMGRETE